jgi:hypothetical protein
MNREWSHFCGRKGTDNRILNKFISALEIGEPDEVGQDHFWTCSYWSVVCPLSLGTAVVLLIKPRAVKPVFDQQPKSF